MKKYNNNFKLTIMAVSLILWAVGCAPVVQQVKSSLGLNPEEELKMALNRSPAEWKEAEAQAAAVDSKVTKGQTIVQDKALNKRLQGMVDRLRAVSHAPNIPFRVKIIESKEINAFNTGGELLYVYTGLINYVGSDDELAGILAHEMAHGLGAHLQREQRSMFLPSIGAVLTSVAIQNKNADQVIGLVNQAMSSGYSRRHEREADILAVVYTHRAGYNPLSFEDFFERISKQANQVKQEKEKDLRKSYTAYQQSSQELEKGKQAYAGFYQHVQQNPGSSAARSQMQQSQKNLENKQKEHDQQYLEYQQAYQTYAQSISQLFPIFQSHPSDPERIDIVNKTYQYIKREITIDQTPPSVKYVLSII